MSYLIKSGEERIAGYLLQDDSRLVICLNDRQEDQAVVTVCAGGDETPFLVPCNAQEHAFEWTKGKVEAVRLSAGTGIRRSHSEKDQVQEEKKQKECSNQENACKKGPDKSVYIQRVNPAYGACILRWPPPPCWPQARYVDGCWKEGEDQVSTPAPHG